MYCRHIWLLIILVISAVILLFQPRRISFMESGDERVINLMKMFEDSSVSESTKLDSGDRGSRDEGVYTFCYNKGTPEKTLKKFVGPDWTFISWPSAGIDSFEETTKQIVNEGNKEPLIDKVGWYGNIHSPLNDVPEHRTRPLLKELGEQHADMCDIVHIDGHRIRTHEEYMSLPDLVKNYKYLLDIGGNGFSARLHYLLFSNRPLLLVDRDYVQYFYEDLEPFVHYVPVKRDLSDFIDQVQWVRNNPEKCKEIACNAQEYALENFTYEKILDRIREVNKNINSS